MIEFKQLQTLQYMGSKSRLLDSICTPIVNDSEVLTVVDLFAGTGSVGFALKKFKHIISNDLEPYSYIINDSILNGCIFTAAQQKIFLRRVSNYYENTSVLLKEALSLEQKFLESNYERYTEYAEFVEATPSVFNSETDKEYYSALKGLVDVVVPGQPEQSVPFPCLFLTYYANAYFGIKQCCQIDAIRASIMELTDERQKKFLLTALMSAMSSAASTTTHFAQFLKVKSVTTFRNLAQKRSRDIVNELVKTIDSYRVAGITDISNTQSECYNMDFYDCLETITLNENVLVYADPPYFKEHYSRYYHVLNTLCLYDYPQLAINPQRKVYSVGRYREDRNVSDFGKKAAALGAFKRLLSICATNKAKLMISYSDNSIVPIDSLADLVGNYYQYSIVKVGLNHSKQGRTSNSTSMVEEYLFICVQPVKKDDIIEKAITKLKNLKPIVDNPGGFIHNYMARKPYNVVAALIECFTNPGATVYDPMFGSGTTIIEASKASRSAIGTDINPVAYRLCRISLKSWDLKRLKETLDKFEATIIVECDSIYKYQADGMVQIIERCHFDNLDDKMIPTKYWFKTYDGKKLSGRKSEIASSDFISQYFEYEKQKLHVIKNHALIPNSRIAIKEDATVFDYFCFRNLCALDKIMSVLSDFKKQNLYGYDVIELVVSSAINLIKLSDKKASSQMPYWTPKKDATSRNAVFIIQKKISAVYDGLSFLNNNCKVHLAEDVNTNCESIRIYNKPAQQLSSRELPANSIDLVLTDPPYTDQVPYLEYSQLWNDILNNKGNVQLEDELVVSDAPSRNKDDDDFYRVYEKIVNRTSEALKDEAYYVMFYHSFDLKSWSKIITLMGGARLRYCNQIPIAAPRKSFKTVMSPKSTLDGNYILIFKKSMSYSENHFNGTVDEAVNLAVECARKILRTRQNVTSQDLYDFGMLKDAIEIGYLNSLSLKYKTFIDVIKEEFLFKNGYWREK